MQQQFPAISQADILVQLEKGLDNVRRALEFETDPEEIRLLESQVEIREVLILRLKAKLGLLN